MHSETPKVSIGMPVYNGQDYLAEAIDGILAQDFADFELIISDNASTDATQAICEQYAARDSRIWYHRMPENVGAAANYNHVFALSRGEYFKWAAHDDLILPGFLRACLAEFIRNHTVENPPSVVHCKSVMIDETGAPFRDDSIINLTESQPAFRIFRLLPCIGANAVFGLMRRDTVIRTRLIGNFLASDYVLLVELALIGPIIQIDDALFHRRVHVGMSNHANRDRRSLLSWFDPKAQSRYTDNIRHVGEYYRSVWMSDALGAGARLACLATLTAAVIRKCVRLLRVELGRRRRNLVAQLVGSRPGHPD